MLHSSKNQRSFDANEKIAMIPSYDFFDPVNACNLLLRFSSSYLFVPFDDSHGLFPCASANFLLLETYIWNKSFTQTEIQSKYRIATMVFGTRPEPKSLYSQLCLE